MPNIGEIWRKDRYYQDDNGAWMPKFILFLGTNRSNDFINRLLTKRAHGRLTVAGCSHAYPYGGFYLGIPGSPRLLQPSWVDIRKQPDIDADFFALRASEFTFEMTLTGQVLYDIINCVAEAEDTTVEQESCLRDSLAALRCN